MTFWDVAHAHPGACAIAVCVVALFAAVGIGNLGPLVIVKRGKGGDDD